MSFLPRFLAIPLFIGGALLCCGARPAVWAQGEASGSSIPPGVRVGAARAIRLVDADGRALQGTFSEPQWETRGGGLFFTREAGGTRNIWRAFPDPRDDSRYPRWRALPVTQFVAPLFASSAVPLDGDRSLLMLSNAANPRGGPQVTFFDLQNPSLRALTNEPGGVLSVAVAPDASAFAFAAATRDAPTREGAGRGQSSEVSISVWKQPLVNRSAPAELMARNAWRPAWQGANWLLVESVTDSSIYRLPVGDEARTGRGAAGAKIAVGGQISASRDGSRLILAGKGGGAAPLYLLSGDGSGLVALGSTEAAQSPALSPDGRFLAFIAPLGEKNEREIWILSLQPGLAPEIPLSLPGNSPVAPFSVPGAQNGAKSVLASAKPRVPAPIAQIRGVRRAARGGLEIWGVASGIGASATLEIGQGAVPNRWEARPIPLPLAPGAPLLLWNPPPSARGVWNFRLTVSGAGGAAQNRFSVQLPLPPRIPARGETRLTPAIGSMPRGGPLPAAPLPDLPAPPSFVAPLPPLLPAPPVRESPVSESPSGAGTTSPPPMSRPNSAPPAPSNLGGDAATFNISNTLAQMKAGQSVNVTFWALNRGMRAWDAGPSREGSVRLVTRWVRFESGNRNGWTYQYMRTPVLPGARTRWNFDLVAPSQPGRYKLIYALQRVAPGWQPPAYNAPQETWPDEFAAIAFAVTVKP